MGSPYRVAHAAWPWRLRLRYWPCAGFWPFLLALVVGVPVAFALRQEARVPSVFTYTGAFRSAKREPKIARTERVCTVHDARTVETRTVPCVELLGEFDARMTKDGPLHRPFIYATRSDPEATDTQRPDVDVVVARELIDACVGSSATIDVPRTLEVRVFDCDYTPSVLALGALLFITALAAVRRRVNVEIDLASGRVAVVERGFFLVRRAVRFPADAMTDVGVRLGASGVLVGRRVEIVCVDGRSVPLSESYTPLTAGAHVRAARKIKAFLSARG
jgi:hypothetical protein